MVKLVMALFVGFFLTKIFHPNIATNGEICVNTLKKDWNPNLGLRHVLIVSVLAVLVSLHSLVFQICLVEQRVI